MWGLAELVWREEKIRWRSLFGTEFTGQSEGRRVTLQWREPVIGHVCVGDDPYGMHLKCIQLVGPPRWQFVREKA